MLTQSLHCWILFPSLQPGNGIMCAVLLSAEFLVSFTGCMTLELVQMGSHIHLILRTSKFHLEFLLGSFRMFVIFLLVPLILMICLRFLPPKRFLPSPLLVSPPLSPPPALLVSGILTAKSALPLFCLWSLLLPLLLPVIFNLVSFLAATFWLMFWLLMFLLVFFLFVLPLGFLLPFFGIFLLPSPLSPRIFFLLLLPTLSMVSPLVSKTIFGLLSKGSGPLFPPLVPIPFCFWF
mmetsp:Transcript_115915/g.201228  ORF Transcript_115915/g.201228 Transcript_115915/m.201228 type:complete len:235 (-) Transcript_115915:1623-2327(-)